MASVAKNGQPSMEEILASIRRIVADDPGGVSPLIDLNRKPLHRTETSGTADVGADDSPDFELPSMFRAEPKPVRQGKLSAKLNSLPKAAPIGRLTDAIRNVSPKAGAGQSPQSRQRQTTPNPTPLERQTHATGGSQSDRPNIHAPGDANRSPNRIQESAQSGGVDFGVRPRVGQSLSSLTIKGADSHAMTRETASTEQNRATRVTNGQTISNPIMSGAAGNVETGQAKTGAHLTGVHGGAVGGQPTATPSPQAAHHANTATQNQSGVRSATGVSSKSPPRVMAPFRDTRMTRMASAELAKPATDPRAEPDHSKAMPAAHTTSNSGHGSEIGAIVPGTLDLPGRSPGVAPGGAGAYGAEDGGLAPNQQTAPHGESAPSHDRFDVEGNPPPLPAGAEVAAPGNIEDATADLLRPMLRQWLSDNMPRMVEKALHIEVAETVRTGKPDDAS